MTQTEKTLNSESTTKDDEVPMWFDAVARHVEALRCILDDLDEESQDEVLQFIAAELDL